MPSVPLRFEKIYNKNKSSILLTSSRDPSTRTRTFINELSSVLPKSIKIGRGKLSLEELNQIILRYNIPKLIVINEYKGNPGKIQLFKPNENSKRPDLILYAIIYGVSLRKELGFNKKISVRDAAIKLIDEKQDNVKYDYINKLSTMLDLNVNDRLIDENNIAYFLVKFDFPYIDIKVFNRNVNIGPNFKLKFGDDINDGSKF
ncbi:putative exosome subunit/U3 small nucleolar ribonucleoprotein (snoRNP) component, contains IMP4 domain [Caldisphaera lagunensis DSM 15908]|uniref:Probable Brix domain-containing ribosomal biogenesis protein n=1 Tax=Caldisphaera lagunensis (strain DSM 15908 / JCM 11604 / ANMR 0165 / IC-154) TaxID=1056495 RepID=L0A8K4_CALLD|nr:exosome subunit/U3 small nucleolar ribonucleoprotein (snoRNP) component [Caldisphaera lagunensis]AFZ70198.1 putative exosome subunit/U3 small nucleolar ribonucleoprotein (snoRNP) component, contains IMP4 domain [Caldisphaera lagunensis DSM 15908]